MSWSVSSEVTTYNSNTTGSVNSEVTTYSSNMTGSVSSEVTTYNSNTTVSVSSRKKYQTGSKITIEINRRNLLQKAMDTVEPPGQRVIKGPAKRKKTRRWQTKQRNTSNDISDKNGTCTSRLIRMHEIRIGFI